MLCNRCTTRIFTFLRPKSTSTSTRAISTTSPRSLPSNPPPATSTSAAQPFSTPLTPSPSKPAKPTTANTNPPPPKSSLPEGTPLRGLAYLKNTPPPLARADTAYPPWLWTLLAPSTKKAAEEEAGDAFAKSKKQRRIANKAAAKAQAKVSMNPRVGVHHVVVPMEEQSVDLTEVGGDPREAREVREELRRSMRSARRQKIKESNFLRGMR